MTSLNVLSPAKINLMLRILGRRADGYHELQTCFKLLPWGDDLEFVWGARQVQPNIKIHGFPHLPDEKNLIYKAAQSLMNHAQAPCDVVISVEKKIPEGGGLGGGSSNAATTLKVLNKQWQCHLSEQELMKLGLALGADVPFFIFGQDALATGVGEYLTPINLKTKYILLLFPDCSVGTASVFQHEDLKRDQTKVSSVEAEQEQHWVNDCLPVVLAQFSPIKAVHQKMAEVGRVYLSGTGSTLFMLFDDAHEAKQAKKMAQTLCSCHLLNSEN